MTAFFILTLALNAMGSYYANPPSASASTGVVTLMNDTTASYGLSTYSGRQVQAEYATSSSALVGKQIDTVTVDLKRVGSPIGTVQVGVFGSDLSVKQLIGTIDSSTIPTLYARYSFSLPAPQFYQIQSGDRIGIKFTGGDSSNFVAIMTDQTNAFDGTNSYLAYYTTAWNYFSGADLYMAMQLHLYGAGLNVTASPKGGTYESPQLITITASAPSVVYYTTDGSTPTTSSLHGPSPLSGIAISTNSTLKFFAKDSSGNTSPVTAQTYSFIPPTTVSVSPKAGTYESAQSVTLAASRTPSTIYYTTDGSTPTTSSPSGPSPLALKVSSNSTLKFFARDSLGYAGPSGSVTYVFIPPTTVSSFPAGGTYNAVQSVALAASRIPSTIYYTTDGSTPTTSSPSGPSPLALKVSTNSTLKFFARDSLGYAGPVGTSTYVILLPTAGTNSVTAQMNDTTASYGLSTYSGRQVQAEYATASSALVGKKIDTVTVDLKRVGSPAGTIQVGVFGSDLSVKQLVGTLDASTVPTLYVQYTFAMPSSQSYQIQSGDRIGIKFAGGDSSNFVAIMTDQANSFDGTNSYLSYYTTAWNGQTGADLTMTLVSHASGNSTGPPGGSTTDKFGITELYPTTSSGRTWVSNWSTSSHKILSGDFDPYDSQFQARGDGYVQINGNGTATLSGSAPRMYVYDPTLKKTWNNVEITLYAKRVSESQLVSYQGITAGARSGSHDDVTYPNVCTDSTGFPNTAYNGRILYDGRSDYEKEVLYHRGDAVSDDGSGVSPSTVNAFSGLSTPIDPTTGFHTMPKNQWIGYKFVARSINNNSGVELETWMDLSNGTNGGKWVELDHYVDKGGWKATSFFGNYSPTNWPCPSVPLDYVVNHVMPYVFVRADYVNAIDYKDFSIREINALP